MNCISRDTSNFDPVWLMWYWIEVSPIIGIIIQNHHRHIIMSLFSIQILNIIFFAIIITMLKLCYCWQKAFFKSILWYYEIVWWLESCMSLDIQIKYQVCFHIYNNITPSNCFFFYHNEKNVVLSFQLPMKIIWLLRSNINN